MTDSGPRPRRRKARSLEHASGSEGRVRLSEIARDIEDLAIGTEEAPTDHAVMLHSATDDLNEALREAEAALRDLALGVESDVTLNTCFDEETEESYEEHLSFVKRGNEWKLLAVTFASDDPENPTEREIQTAPRRIRILAANALDGLLEQMLRAAQQQLEDVTSATSAARAFAARVRHLRSGR